MTYQGNSAIRELDIRDDDAVSSRVSNRWEAVSFGPFSLHPAERLLERTGVPVRIGGRALDVLIALVGRPGEVVSSRTLMGEVWPTTTVGEATLRMQMTSLRRALGSDNASYIANVAGRGYCFVVPVTRSDQANDIAVKPSKNTTRLLQPPVFRIIGREDTLIDVTEAFVKSGFLTIVGPAGIGKTTVALQVIHDLRARFNDNIYIVDLGALSDAKLVTTALLTTLGLPVTAADLKQSLENFAQSSPILLVFDNCEHVIEAIAPLIEDFFGHIDNISILATSREALRVEGEWVYHLPPLQFPPLGTPLSASEALAFSAIQLLVERASANANGFEFLDEDVPAAAEICARFDGLPLAIEIAAGRIAAFGIQEAAASLEDKLGLIWQGRRTAPPRQRTLTSALDWSYGLLSEVERFTLQALSVFVGSFSLEAALAVAPEGHAHVADALVGLVSKSLVSAAPSGQLQLLQTTRAYALDRLDETGDRNEVARRHADYFCRLLMHLNKDAALLSAVDSIALYNSHLGNVRAALGWSFGVDGDVELGASLSAHSSSLFIALSLLPECRAWMIRIRDHLPALGPDIRRDMQIHAAFGACSMFTRGSTPETRQALEQALQLAVELEDAPYTLGLLGVLNVFLERAGDYHAALDVALRYEAISRNLNDPVATMVSRWTLGVTYYLSGDHFRAQTYCESALSPLPSDSDRFVRFLGYDHRARALVVETISLWVSGFPHRAARAGELLVQEAERSGQSVAMCFAYISAAIVCNWSGDFDKGSFIIEKIIARSRKYSLLPYQTAALALKYSVQTKNGDIEIGVQLLQESLNLLYQEKYLVLATGLAVPLAEAQASVGRFTEAQETINTALELNVAQGEQLHIAELWRLKGEILASQPARDTEAAEACFMKAIDWSQRQSALSWELRASTALGRLWAETGQAKRAHRLIKTVYDQFTEGFDTADLTTARRLIDSLGDYPA